MVIPADRPSRPEWPSPGLSIFGFPIRGTDPSADLAAQRESNTFIGSEVFKRVPFRADAQGRSVVVLSPRPAKPWPPAAFDVELVSTRLSCRCSPDGYEHRKMGPRYPTHSC